MLLSFISLLPKVAGADDINKFGHISLLGSVYKISAKVLTSRFNGSHRQSCWPLSTCFHRWSTNFGCSLIANECIDSCHKSNLTIVTYKLDVEKTYDHVYWDFLMTIFKGMGFRRK